MLGLGPDRRYADVVERALYNGALAGLSLDGTTFFYENPLESRGGHHRWRWHRCPCCPPNIARLVASVGTYLYGVAEREIAVHLHCESVAELDVAGTRVRIAQETHYPSEGRVHLSVYPATPVAFTLHLRLPGWSGAIAARLNGEPLDVAALSRDGYLTVHRLWSPGDAVELDIDMPVERLRAHPSVGANQGRVALQRGPLIYCLEEADNGALLNSLVLSPRSRFRCELADNLGGAPALVADGLRETSEADGPLYRSDAPMRGPATIRAAPYFAWDNRAPGEMLVWIRQEEEA